MAVLPAKNAADTKQHVSGARIRQRKISVKQPLAIFRQKDLPALDTPNDLEPSQVNHLNSNGQQQRDPHAIETGVEKNEEEEVHLQQVINAAQKALLGSQDKSDKQKKAEEEAVYIPTPDASKVWQDAKKYYSGQVFREPESYIKFSATVEDTVGVEFNMDEEDEVFLNDVLNKKPSKKAAKEPKCTEAEFEIVCDKLEKAIEQRQPFLSMDPSNILSYQELHSYIIDDIKSGTGNDATGTNQNLKYLLTTSLKEKLSKELNQDNFETLFDKDPQPGSGVLQPRPIPQLFELFGEQIYEHWKNRKIERKGHPIHPVLKFEDPNANEKDNDNDPYVCFRRREFRQARKTRRADTLGVERIRMLQKSIHRAHDLILSVTKRELLKLELLESEREIFRLRSEAKSVKRAVGVKGDDYLFFPHKRKKIIKPVEEDEENIRRKTERKRQDMRESLADAVSTKDKVVAAQQEGSGSSNQPYVKLPPSKIPDMDLVTVSLVLKEKNETIKRAVLEKLRKRKEQDKGFVNITDDPYQPYFNISTNSANKELTHIPYLSIAAANLHQITTTNVIGEPLKKLLEEGKKLLPGMKTFRGSNGELIPSKPFPHLLSLLEDKINNSKVNSVSYVAQLLSNIETHNFSAYNNGYGQQQQRQELDADEEARISDPIFRLRKRAGRANQTFVDRRGLVSRPDDVLDEFMKFDEQEETKGDNDAMDVDSEEGEIPDVYKESGIPTVYESRYDVVNRLDSRWRFDDDLSENQRGDRNPFDLDPSRLNCISDDTQSIRFGSMLLSKSYGLLRESVHQKQQLLIQQAKMRALQQQSSRKLQQSANSGNVAKYAAASKGPGGAPNAAQYGRSVRNGSMRSPIQNGPLGTRGSLSSGGRDAKKAVASGQPLSAGQIAALKADKQKQQLRAGSSVPALQTGSPQMYNSSPRTPNGMVGKPSVQIN